MSLDVRKLEKSVSDTVSAASAAAQELKRLYPLENAEQLNNDVHYGDNLQVKQTFQLAQNLLQSRARTVSSPDTFVQLATELTLADAEYVFEGALAIPGRPQELVDALLAANDAYDTAHELHDEFGAVNILQVAACLSDGNSVSVDLDTLDGIIDEVADFDDVSDDCANVLRGFELGLQSAHIISESSDGLVCEPALALLVANEYLDAAATPRTFATSEQLIELVDNGLGSVEAENILKGAMEQWQTHKNEILWNKDEAKRLAKEEDERKSKEALAAKFAHVKDDPAKEKIEL
ncbi:hypothetical protein ACFQY8_03045 [Alloscardovia venturai]|uniref:Uncharacterized protein n=1 Tax=Alloscardovia venturai TaxID=1769421 RepID=A0ABW2Y3A4_9BIFI